MDIYHLFDYIKGFLQLRLKGIEKIRFLNLCKGNHMNLWNVQTDKEDILFCTSINNFYRMRKLRRKCNVKLRIQEKKGLIFHIKKYRKRYFFFVGILLFFFLIKIISMYIWNISFDGNYSYTDIELLRFLAKNGVKNGVAKNSIDCEELEFLLRHEYNDITWVSVELDGTKLIVHIKENFDSHIASEEDRPYNITSNEDCIVASIITRSGIPYVKQGDMINKGDMLVSGAVNINNDAGDIINYKFVCSDADILGYVRETINDSFDMEYQAKTYSGDSSKSYKINLFNKSFYLSGLPTHYKESEIVRDYRYFTITDNFYLPFSIEKIRCKEYSSHTETYTEEEAKAIANEKINNYINNLSEKGIQIIENNVTIEVNNSKCIISGDMLLLKPIGQIEYIDESSYLENIVHSEILH